jgi:hypothetical protein
MRADELPPEIRHQVAHLLIISCTAGHLRFDAFVRLRKSGGYEVQCRHCTNARVRKQRAAGKRYDRDNT